MKKSIFIIFFLYNIALYSQEITESILPFQTYPNWFMLEENGIKDITINNFIEIYKKDFKLSDRDTLIQVLEEKNASPPKASSSGLLLSTKYKQYYNNYEVEAAMLITHSVNDTIEIISGNTLRGLDLITNYPISEEHALIVALSNITGVLSWQDTLFINNLCFNDDGTLDSTCVNRFLPHGKLWIAKKQGDSFLPSNYQFVWEFHISTTQPDSSYRVLVNANTGALFDISSDVVEGQYRYGEVQTLYDGYRANEMQTFRCSFCTNWKLEDSYGNVTTLRGLVLKDKDNVWTSVDERPATSAHWALRRVSDYYRLKLDNYNVGKDVYVNAGVNWNNAGYSHSLNSIKIGQAANTKWLSTIDIVGHELTHKLVFQTANLGRYGESGALHESFADIFGTMSERYARGNNGNWNWTLGEDASTSRSMSNPNIYQQPSYYQGTFWADPNNIFHDYGGVHINSGVQNKWFYLLSQSVGTDKAEKIAYKTLTQYLWPTAKYHDALIASTNAAKNLFGNCSPERNAVISSWSTVGVRNNNLLLCNNTNPDPDPEKHNNNNIEQNSVKFTIYPNPTVSTINIVSNFNIKNAKIEILNIKGQCLYSANFNENSLQIHLSDFKSGVYIVKIIHPEFIKTEKLIIL